MVGCLKNESVHGKVVPRGWWEFSVWNERVVYAGSGFACRIGMKRRRWMSE